MKISRHLAGVAAIAVTCLSTTSFGDGPRPPDEPMPQPPVQSAARRIWSLGISGGFGAGAAVPLGCCVAPAGGAGLQQALLPAVDLRVYAKSGVAVGVSIPLGNMILQGAMGEGLVLAADVFVDFNLDVATNVRMQLGPGLGVFGGTVRTLGVSYPAGGARLLMQMGPEFLVANGRVSVSILGRPYLGLNLSSDLVSQNLVPTLIGGFLGVLSISLNLGW